MWGSEIHCTATITSRIILLKLSTKLQCGAWSRTRHDILVIRSEVSIYLFLYFYFLKKEEKLISPLYKQLNEELSTSLPWASLYTCSFASTTVGYRTSVLSFFLEETNLPYSSRFLFSHTVDFKKSIKRWNQIIAVLSSVIQRMHSKFKTLIFQNVKKFYVKIIYSLTAYLCVLLV